MKTFNGSKIANILSGNTHATSGTAQYAESWTLNGSTLTIDGQSVEVTPDAIGAKFIALAIAQSKKDLKGTFVPNLLEQVANECVSMQQIRELGTKQTMAPAEFNLKTWREDAIASTVKDANLQSALLALYNVKDSMTKQDILNAVMDVKQFLFPAELIAKVEAIEARNAELAARYKGLQDAGFTVVSSTENTATGIVSLTGLADLQAKLPALGYSIANPALDVAFNYKTNSFDVTVTKAA